MKVNKLYQKQLLLHIVTVSVTVTFKLIDHQRRAGMTNITQAVSNSGFAIPVAVTQVVGTFLTIVALPMLVIYLA